MISNRFLVLISVFLALCACKTQSTIHNSRNGAQSTIIRDSISITYKQGTVQHLSISNIEEQPTPIGVKGAAIESRKNSCVPAANKPAVPPTTHIRVDTLFVERWHTQTIREPTTLPYEGKAGKGSFYKNCTLGFFILLLLIFGRIALKMWKRFFFLS